MDPAAASDKALQQVATVQGLFGGGPVAAFAAIFCVSFFALLGWHLWRMHLAHQAHLETAIQANLTVTRIAALEDNLRTVRLDVERHHNRRPRETPHEQG